MVICISVLVACICVPCMCCDLGGQRRKSDLPEPYILSLTVMKVLRIKPWPLHEDLASYGRNI